jgi:solute carrier family 50 protein (sugar transporter)
VPFPAQAANSAGWVAYSYVLASVGATPAELEDNLQAAALIFWPNALGLYLGLFFTLSCYGLADTKTRDRQLAIVLALTLALSVVGAVGTLGRFSPDALRSLWGFTSNAILILYYAAPLSTVVSVVKTRSSASLHVGLAFMMVLNGALWVGFGLATGDAFIWAPNAAGAATGLVLIGLIAAYPPHFRRRPKLASSPAPSADGSDAPVLGSAESRHRAADALA